MRRADAPSLFIDSQWLTLTEKEINTVYKFKTSLLALAGLLALVGVVAAITPFTGYGQQSPEAATAVQDVQVVNATTTPVPTRDVDAARATSIITLYFAGTATGNVFRRVLSNGVMGANEFVVPAGQALVVTDVEWVHLCGSCTGGSGDKITLELFGASGAHRLVYLSVAPFTSNGQAGASESMETGFAVAEGGHIALGPSFSNGSSSLTVFLHGYLVPAS